MKRYFSLIFISVLAGCTEKVSFQTADEMRAIARSNSDYSANAFRNTLYPTLQVFNHNDSSINESCPQGDGWVSLDLMSEGKTQVKIKCSSVSLNIGCMTESDFKSRPAYSNQDGHCNRDIPMPLPKLVK